MSETRQHARTDFWPAIGLLAGSIGLSIMLCAPVLNSPLVSDDWVLLDALVRNGIWGAWGGGGHEMLGFFRPLMTLTLWVNLKIGGLNPFGYHLFNAVIHGICGWLVGLIVWQLNGNHARRRSLLAPVIACLLFLVHPSHVEPVAWVSSRPDLMACAFALGALAVWIGNLPKTIKIAAAGLLFVLAMLAKESAVVLPLIVFAYEIIVGRRGNLYYRTAQALRRSLPIFMILIGFLVWRAFALGHAVGGYGSGRILAFNPSFWARNVLVATIRSVLPAIPSSAFEQERVRMLYASATILCAVGILLFAVVQLAKKTTARSAVRPLVVFSIVAFFVSLIPVINLPLSIRSSEGERFIYLASSFMVMALCIGLVNLFRKVIEWILIPTLIIYVIGFEVSLMVWRDAGHIAGDLIDGLDRLSRKRPIEQVDVVNLPDNLRGAYVFRNGFVEAAKLNGITPERIKTVRVQSTRVFHSTKENYRNAKYGNIEATTRFISKPNLSEKK